MQNDNGNYIGRFMGRREQDDPYALPDQTVAQPNIPAENAVAEETPTTGPWGSNPDSDNTGFSGGPTSADMPTDAPDYTKRGQYSTFNGTSDKYNMPWDQMSERYKMQTVLSHFDPAKGITPEVIAALNAAKINGATFSGDRDKLSAHGLSKWENYDGQEGVGDVIQGFNDPNNKNKSWGAWSPEGAGDSAMGEGGDSLSNYYADGSNATGGITTQMDSDQLKSILQRYYGNAGMGRMRFGANTRI